ncbi:MAG: Hsp20/alpha crystallin family protein [Gemmataceae bacterium]|nr:Hsp20/alpha crystallin family protein [Gemmataceae bacterium]
MTRNRQHPFGAFWSELNQAQDEFTRLVNRLSGVTGVAGPELSVWEDEHNVYAEADLPGIEVAKLEITVTGGNQLTVQGERQAPKFEGASWLRQERSFGKFARVVTLPTLVDADKVDAKYEAGVLRLTLPKHEAAKPRKIQVKGA